MCSTGPGKAISPIALLRADVANRSNEPPLDLSPLECGAQRAERGLPNLGVLFHHAVRRTPPSGVYVDRQLDIRRFPGIVHFASLASHVLLWARPDALYGQRPRPADLPYDPYLAHDPRRLRRPLCDLDPCAGVEREV